MRILIKLKPFSWHSKIFLKKHILSPKGVIYGTSRVLFQKIPFFLRVKLERPVNKIVFWINDHSTAAKNIKSNSNSKDISWNEFEINIISNRSAYKGVFIQEAVIDWNVPLYQRPQHISSALGRLGYLVIYRTNNWTRDNVDGFREVEKNVWITNRDEVNNLTGVIRSIYSTAYSNLPELIEKNGRKGISIYEYIDHIDPEISGEAENIKRLFNLKSFAFSGGVDFVIASAKQLYDEAVQAVGEDKVILIPNGVDAAHYRNLAHHQVELPNKLLEFREKYKVIVGYFGALAPWLWYDCIEELVAIRSDIGFIFIGPDYYGGAENLPKKCNVLRLDAIDYKILPAYAHKFDVCIIPFKPGEIAKSTSPLKLFEYFAMEKPVVVSADMRECTVYEEVFRGGSADELSKAIDEAVQIKDDKYFKEKLRNLADKNDWSQRAKVFEICFEELIKLTILDLTHVFRVSRAFVELYRKTNPDLNWAAGSASLFLNGMSNLSRMYVEFAMSCVLRGISMAELLDLTGLLHNKKRYLDVGTGYGGFPVAFSAHGFEEVIGIELQDHLVQLAKANTINVPNAKVFKHNIVENSTDDLGLFDLITCNDVIEHVSDPEITIKKLALMLNAAGVVCLEIPNRNCIASVISDGHFQIFAITLLDRDIAAYYYSQTTSKTEKYYLNEMGYMHPLNWYLERLQQCGVRPEILDTHKVCEFDLFPAQLKLLESKFLQWKSESADRLAPLTSENIELNVNKYLELARYEYASAITDLDRSHFVDKYLRAFWTVVGVK